MWRWWAMPAKLMRQLVSSSACMHAFMQELYCPL